MEVRSIGDCCFIVVNRLITTTATALSAEYKQEPCDEVAAFRFGSLIVKG